LHLFIKGRLWNVITAPPPTEEEEELVVVVLAAPAMSSPAQTVLAICVFEPCALIPQSAVAVAEEDAVVAVVILAGSRYLLQMAQPS
jgi:hypothetical protein